MSSDSPVNHQWPDAELQDSSKSYALSGRIMLSSIIILFVVVIFLVFLHLYARWYLVRIQQRRNRHSRRTRSTRIVFYVDNNPPPASTGGLDASVIKSLPVFVFSSETDENTPECSVCLSEFEPGEKGRVLPKCKHSFHTECIDMWFHSNSTCPLCRSPVEALETMSLVNSTVLEPGSSTSVPPSVQTTSLVERTKRVNDVRIDVPNRTELSAESQLTSPSQGFLSPGSRLLSRIINMSRKSPSVSPSSGVGPSCVHPLAATELDIESASQESTRAGSFR